MRLYRFEGAVFVEGSNLNDAKKTLAAALLASINDDEADVPLPGLHPLTKASWAPEELQPCCSMLAPYHQPDCTSDALSR